MSKPKKNPTPRKNAGKARVDTKEGDIKEKKQPKRRFKPGMQAMKEIRKYQKSTDLLLHKASFNRIVRDIAVQRKSETRFQSTALLALQEATECYTLGLLEDSNMVVQHCKRLTLYPQDIDLARRIRGQTTSDRTFS